MTIAAVKTGMLNDAATVRAVAEAITRHNLHPLIVDPVMVATSGDALLEDDAVAALRDELLPLADLLTPNLPEAARLLGVPVAADEAQMTAQAQALLDLGCKAVVLKGGHASGPEAVDIFLQRARSRFAWYCRASQRQTRMGPAAPSRPRSPPCWPSATAQHRRHRGETVRTRGARVRRRAADRQRRRPHRPPARNPSVAWQSPKSRRP